MQWGAVNNKLNVLTISYYIDEAPNYDQCFSDNYFLQHQLQYIISTNYEKVMYKCVTKLIAKIFSNYNIKNLLLKI